MALASAYVLRCLPVLLPRHFVSVGVSVRSLYGVFSLPLSSLCHEAGALVRCVCRALCISIPASSWRWSFVFFIVLDEPGFPPCCWVSSCGYRCSLHACFLDLVPCVVPARSLCAWTGVPSCVQLTTFCCYFVVVCALCVLLWCVCPLRGPHTDVRCRSWLLCPSPHSSMTWLLLVSVLHVRIG